MKAAEIQCFGWLHNRNILPIWKVYSFSLQTSIKYAVCPGATKLLHTAVSGWSAEFIICCCRCLFYWTGSLEHQSPAGHVQCHVSCCPLTSGEGDPPDPPTHLRGVLFIPEVAVVTVPARQGDSVKRRPRASASESARHEWELHL